MALVIEPDSLGNVVTNAGNKACTDETVTAYKEGVRYAVKTLATVAPHAAIYIDAAHGGWMGYEHNAADFAKLIISMGITNLIRGFSTNVANYQPLGFDSICPSEVRTHSRAQLACQCNLPNIQRWQPLTSPLLTSDELPSTPTPSPGF